MFVKDTLKEIKQIRSRGKSIDAFLDIIRDNVENHVAEDWSHDENQEMLMGAIKEAKELLEMLTDFGRDLDMLRYNNRSASRRAYRGRGYQDPCNSMSYSDYDDALEGLEECHDERIRENKVEDAFDFLQQLYDISDDFDFVDAMEEASSEYRLNSAEYQFLKWHYDNEM